MISLSCFEHIIKEIVDLRMNWLPRWPNIEKFGCKSAGVDVAVQLVLKRHSKHDCCSKYKRDGMQANEGKQIAAVAEGLDQSMVNGWKDLRTKHAQRTSRCWDVPLRIKHEALNERVFQNRADEVAKNQTLLSIRICRAFATTLYSPLLAPLDCALLGRQRMLFYTRRRRLAYFGRASAIQISAAPRIIRS